MHLKYPRVSTVNCITTWTFRDKLKQQQQRPADSFFGLNFNVYIDVDNREIARTRFKTMETNFVGRIT